MKMRRLLVEVLVPVGTEDKLLERQIVLGAESAGIACDALVLRDTGTIKFTVDKWAELKSMRLAEANM